MKSFVIAAAVTMLVSASASSAATFISAHGFASNDICNTTTNIAPFATGQVLGYSDQSCLGGYTVSLDTLAQTITLTGAVADFADYSYSALTITDISDVTITSLSTIQFAPLFDTTDFSFVPTPQLSFTSNSISIIFGSAVAGGDTFEFNFDGTGQAIFAYNGGGNGVVPEPASWAMLIAGFGLIGATMRRRRTMLAA